MAKASLKACAAALRKHDGVIAWAAKEVGLSRNALWQRVQNTPSLKAIVEEVDEGITDHAEGNLKSAVTAKEQWATKFWLVHKGKSRGYGRIAFDDDQLDKLARALALDPEALAKLAAGEG